MAIKDYSTTPDMNTTISGINIAEGCAPSGINNAIRQLMADVKAEKDARDVELSANATAQSTKDAQQDSAIQQAQTAANNAASAASNAASAASAAQSTANRALEKATNITVPVTSVNGKTGAVEVGTVRSVNGASADAAGNVNVNVSLQAVSGKYKGMHTFTLPAGGTWAWVASGTGNSNAVPDFRTGTAAGGTVIRVHIDYSDAKEFAYIAIKIA